ncbi:MAG TPA: alpha/beta fold hydrolase [Steroidobacteraceae bacterium]|jgi:pimeloyl-ACP methyl ester carboxylesterase|nr:alpha/beta fold hydrolase [Steroidobacteraceae bacterium]
MKGRTILRIFALTVCAALLLWRYFEPRSHTGGARIARAVPAAALSSAPQRTAPPRHWQLGTLNLTSCELPHLLSGATTAAWCADFEVAENPSRPEGRHIGLHLAVIRSDAGKPAADMVVMLAGGPGEAATQAFADTGVYAGVLKHHNVLLLDQRGTGSSNPLSCKKTPQGQQAPATGAEVPSPEEMRDRVVGCLAEVQRTADPRYYTTTIAVEDLEKVRRALGAPLFDLIGVSYGTRVAQQFLMRHPDSVRTAVLDSPAPNQLILGAGFAASLEAALQRDFADCTAAPACKKAFDDPMRTLYRLRDALRANPREVTFRDPRTFESVSRPVTAGLLVGVVRLFAYEPETAALLPLSIDAADHGDFTPLLGQQRLLDADLAGDITGGMGMSVICSEDADELREPPQDADTILGNLLVAEIKAHCGLWPHGAMPADFHAPLRSAKPILILSGSRDPVTPPKYGEQIMQGLSNARHLVLNGQGHAALGRGCMPKLIEQFMDRPDPKGLDAGCLDRLGPTPAFVDFNGAAP